MTHVANNYSRLMIRMEVACCSCMCSISDVSTEFALAQFKFKSRSWDITLKITRRGRSRPVRACASACQALDLSLTPPPLPPHHHRWVMAQGTRTARTKMMNEQATSPPSTPSWTNAAGKCSILARIPSHTCVRVPA